MTELFPEYRPSWETENHRLIREHAREFFTREAVPHQEKWAEQHCVDRDFWNKTGAAGLLAPEVDEQYGGAGGDFGHEAAVFHELNKAGDTAFGYSIHSSICVHYLSTYGTEEQKKRWLPGTVSGDLVVAIAMTEPGTGSDLQAIRTTAVRDGNHYVINGNKTFISNGTHCDLVIIVAKTDPEARSRGISLIVAETKDLPGFQRGRVLAKIGQHGQDTRELSFTDMRVPVENLLGGEEGKGFGQLMDQLPRERLLIGISGLAMAEAAVLETIAYVKERQAFGEPILNFQNTKFELAECKADVLAGKALVDYGIQRCIEGTLDASTGSIVKLWGSEKQCEIIDRCLQLFGGYGYMMEYPIAQKYAAARVQKIYGGTNEIMKELIARSL